MPAMPAAPAVLTDDDHRFFAENGYVIVTNAVPPENLRTVIGTIWEFLGMNPHDPEDWYRPPHRHGGMVELYQHQSLWDNRQNPRVYQAFSEILGTPKLWVSMDRANMKPPQHPDHPDYDHKGFTHWDMDVSKLDATPFGVQGVLALTDTDPDMGGFQCVPGFHKAGVLEDWLASLPEESRFSRSLDLDRLPSGMSVVPIPMKAGDLLIWDRRLAHGNGHNTSKKPRLAQYITMHPARDDNEEARQTRIQMWRERQGPKGDAFPGDPRGWERAHNKTAELTPLGRKLLGLDRWDSNGEDAG